MMPWTVTFHACRFVIKFHHISTFFFVFHFYFSYTHKWLVYFKSCFYAFSVFISKHAMNSLFENSFHDLTLNLTIDN